MNKLTTLGLKALIKESIGLGANGSGLLITPGTKEGDGTGIGPINGLLIRLFGLGVLFVGLVIVGLGVVVGVVEPPPPEDEVPAVAVIEFDDEPDPDPLTALIKTV